jgi:hypothetical protein
MQSLAVDCDGCCILLSSSSQRIPRPHSIFPRFSRSLIIIQNQIIPLFSASSTPLSSQHAIIFTRTLSLSRVTLCNSITCCIHQTLLRHTPRHVLYAAAVRSRQSSSVAGQRVSQECTPPRVATSPHGFIWQPCDVCSAPRLPLQPAPVSRCQLAQINMDRTLVRTTSSSFLRRHRRSANPTHSRCAVSSTQTPAFARGLVQTALCRQHIS